MLTQLVHEYEWNDSTLELQFQCLGGSEVFTMCISKADLQTFSLCYVSANLWW